jgi:hypothetical protein
MDVIPLYKKGTIVHKGNDNFYFNRSLGFTHKNYKISIKSILQKL